MASWQPGWGEFPEALMGFWTERHLCHLASVRPDGRPHLVPVGIALDHEEECAWVITFRGSVKARLVGAAGADGMPVSGGAVDGGRWSSLEGRAHLRDDAKSVARACERYASRYRVPRENPDRVALRIEVDRFVASASLLD